MSPINIKQTEASVVNASLFHKKKRFNKNKNRSFFDVLIVAWISLNFFSRQHKLYYIYPMEQKTIYSQKIIYSCTSNKSFKKSL